MGVERYEKSKSRIRDPVRRVVLPASVPERGYGYLCGPKTTHIETSNSLGKLKKTLRGLPHNVRRSRFWLTLNHLQEHCEL